MRLSLRKAAFLLGALALLAASCAQAAISQNEGLRIGVRGQIRPFSVPRSTPAPVKLRLSAKLTATNGGTPPHLQEIDLRISNRIIVQTAGLSYCPLSTLESVSPTAARRICGAALVGHGVVFEGSNPYSVVDFAAPGVMLAFNARIGSRPAIFAQVTTGAPLPFSYVIRIEVKRIRGTFGTELLGTIPPSVLSYGTINGFQFAFGRRYSRGGRRVSVLSAECPTGRAAFPDQEASQLAVASFTFSDGRRIASTYNGRCANRQ